MENTLGIFQNPIKVEYYKYVKIHLVEESTWQCPFIAFIFSGIGQQRDKFTIGYDLSIYLFEKSYETIHDVKLLQHILEMEIGQHQLLLIKLSFLIVENLFQKTSAMSMSIIAM